ncbi:MAG TPA: AMP-binding protein, partial [Burkholderiales bacterium]
MAAIPLIRNYHPGATFAFRDGRPVSVEAFLSDVRRLAGLIPDRQFVVNLCSDRYRFAVGFSAALARRQTSLLPQNLTPEFLNRLNLDFPGVYCLSDGTMPTANLETCPYPESTGESASAASVPHIYEGQLASIGFTSGSTGQPTPHPKSWGALAASGKAGCERFGLGAFGNMSVLGTVPQQHMYGLESTILMVMQGGLAMHSGRPFFAADICAELQALPRPRGLVTTPVHLRLLLAEAGDLPGVDFLLCATSPLSPQLATEAEARFGAPLYEIYGCTEAGQVATRRPAHSQRWQPLPGVT